ncbi:hypothetical protein D3C78_1641860 [compost metagenome]
MPVGATRVTVVAESWLMVTLPLVTLLVSASVALFSPVSETSDEAPETTGGESGRLLTLTVICAVSIRLPSLAVTVSTCWRAVS